MKRLAAALPLALLCPGLLLGLVLLGGIFAGEREESLRALDERDVAVVRAAQESVRARLARGLDESRAVAKDALEDPLQEDGALLLFRAGEQVLPRVARFRTGSAAEAMWQGLQTRGPRAAATAEEGPVAQRLLKAAAVVDALRSGRDEEVERTVRAFLAHRALYQVPTPKDVVTTLWLTERLAASGRADPALLRALLRDGVRGERNAQLVGLQRLLVARPEQFSKEDFGKVAARVQEVSERLGVDAQDFAERVRGMTGVAASATGGSVVPLSLPVREPTLAYGYYVEPDGPAGARGLRVDLPATLLTVTEELRALGLLTAEEALTLRLPDGPSPLQTLGVALESPDSLRARGRVDSRLALKTFLLFGSGLLAAGFVVFASLAQARKRRLVALRGELLATVSHELRTPLSAIRVMAETLERRAAGTPGVGDYPARIVGEADALGRLVENILAFNQLEKGKLAARPEPLSLTEVLERVSEEVRASAPARVHVHIEGADGVTVKADPTLLPILLSNLLHNAARHAGKDEVQIHLRAKDTADRLSLTVADDGPGIPKEDWARIFDEYERSRGPTKPARGGSGLGLAICRRIMALHRGEIRVAQSGPGGTTFELVFPR